MKDRSLTAIKLVGMELRHLRYFASVAEELHFGRAAARLFVTQSTLSVQIRQLETEVGGPLLVRTSRSVALTEAGRLLYTEAARALDQAERALHVARQSVLGEAGSIRIGFAGVAAYSGDLPADLRRFHNTHPNVEIELRELPPAGVVDELHNGSIDLGYTPDLNPIESADLVRIHRKHIHLTAALCEDHPLCAAASISRDDLLDETLILPATNPADATVADRIRPPTHAGSARLRLVPTTLGVLTLAAAGIGVAVVPADTEHISITGLAYRPITDADGPEMTVLTRPDETLGPVLAFLNDLQAATSQT
jgi:DNA-binding transcriptional LysR family regulator